MHVLKFCKFFKFQILLLIRRNINPWKITFVFYMSDINEQRNDTLWAVFCVTPVFSCFFRLYSNDVLDKWTITTNINHVRYNPYKLVLMIIFLGKLRCTQNTFGMVTNRRASNCALLPALKVSAVYEIFTALTLSNILTQQVSVWRL